MVIMMRLMETNMKITIICHGVERTYQGDFDELYNRDWDERVRDIIDTAKPYVEEELEEEASNWF